MKATKLFNIVNDLETNIFSLQQSTMLGPGATGFTL